MSSSPPCMGAVDTKTPKGRQQREISQISNTVHHRSMTFFLLNYFSGAGGGTIFLNVTNLLEIDGALSADGADAQPQGGGGSGGSVWIYCYIIKGFGKITANGGSSPEDTSVNHYHGGGGAGGRVAVYFTKNDTFSYFRWLYSDTYKYHYC